MKYLPYIRLLSYAVIIGIAIMASPKTRVIPIELSSSSANTTSVLNQMLKGDVLSSLIGAERVTAHVIWSDDGVHSPTSNCIKTKSEAAEIDATTKGKIVEMLSLDRPFEDGGEPCLCAFQPQLRLSWASRDKTVSYIVLVSGLSHGEIRSYRNNDQKSMIRDGHFIPLYLEIMESVFPGHKTTVGLRQYDDEERKPARANTAKVPNGM